MTINTFSSFNDSNTYEKVEYEQFFQDHLVDIQDISLQLVKASMRKIVKTSSVVSYGRRTMTIKIGIYFVFDTLFNNNHSKYFVDEKNDNLYLFSTT